MLPKRKMLFTLFALLALCLPWSATAQGSPADGSGPPQYTIKSGDSISIGVWGFPDLSVTSVTVRPDGYISFPTVGDVRASGLTTTELAAKLTDEAARFVKNPRVSVQLLSTQSEKYYVTGMVARPGSFPLLVGTGVNEAIAAAGDFAEDANRNEVVILREGKQTKVSLVPGTDGMPAANPALQPNDTLQVGQAVVYMQGAWNNTGQIPLRRGTTLTQAVASSGGPRADADLDRVQIIRNGPKGEIITVNLREVAKEPKMDPALMPGDTVKADPGEVRSQDAFVTGGVSKPGAYRYVPDWRDTVADAVNSAGPASDSDLTKVKLRREWTPGEVTERKLDFRKVEERTVKLQNNDYISITRVKKDNTVGMTAAIVGAVSAFYAAFFK